MRRIDFLRCEIAVRLLTRVAAIIAFAAGVQVAVVAQSVVDSTGDIRAGDPTFLDLLRVRVRQATDKVQIDFYPSVPIPRGNQSGITATTVFEVYIDTDGNATTGAPLDDIGYDYKLRVDLSAWNGKSWIDGEASWGFDAAGNWTGSSGFYLSAADLVSQRFRWEFSLISLKWSQINWITRIYYKDHWTDAFPTSDTQALPSIPARWRMLTRWRRSSSRSYTPKRSNRCLMPMMCSEPWISAARIESTLCGTQFTDKPLRVMFNPWMNGVACAGNPVMLGSWNWRDEPAWFMYFHELGHNFTLAADRFQKLYPGGGYTSIEGDDWHFGTDFGEAWATMVGLYAVREMYTRPSAYGIPSAATQGLQALFQQTSSVYSSALKQYMVIRDHSHLYPDVVDGIFLAVADSFGYDTIRRWFTILRPPGAPWPLLDPIRPTTDYDGAKIRSLTITACAFSVAAGTDLRSWFIDSLDFPIDLRLYDQIRPEIERIIKTATGVERANKAQPQKVWAMEGFPNPVRSRMTVVFELPLRSNVQLTVHNILGQLLDRVDAGTFNPGTHQLMYDVTGLSNGVYFISLISAAGVRTKKLFVLK